MNRHLIIRFIENNHFDLCDVSVIVCKFSRLITLYVGYNTKRSTFLYFKLMYYLNFAHVYVSNIYLEAFDFIFGVSVDLEKRFT